MAGQRHGQRALPVGRGDVLDERDRTGDAGVVHEHVEPAAGGQDAVHPAVERRPLRDVHDGCVQAIGGGRADGVGVDVADVDIGALRGEGAGDDEAEAARGGRDRDSEAHGPIIPNPA